MEIESLSSKSFTRFRTERNENIYPLISLKPVYLTLIQKGTALAIINCEETTINHWKFLDFTTHVRQITKYIALHKSQASPCEIATHPLVQFHLFPSMRRRHTVDVIYFYKIYPPFLYRPDNKKKFILLSVYLF